MHAITAIVQQHDIPFIFIFPPVFPEKADSKLTGREIHNLIKSELIYSYGNRSTLSDEKRIHRILDALPLAPLFSNYITEVRGLLLTNKIKYITLEFSNDIAKDIHKNPFNLNARGHRKLSEKMLKKLKVNLNDFTPI